MNIYLEIFGYTGTALIIVSMMMTSVLKLRIFNMCGSFISMIYALFCDAWPVVVLNFSLICINLFQTIRQFRQKDNFGHVIAGADDKTVRYFLDHYKNDIQAFFPDYSLTPDAEIHVMFVSGEIIGVLIGTRSDDTCRIELDYIIRGYRDIKAGQFLLSRLKEQGVNKLTAPDSTYEHKKYLTKLGFCSDGNILTKEI
ncbi:MAG: YgjV family protein [Ruminococcus sp.]|nr:YgjV family protein [Ruminococcus sp.]